MADIKQTGIADSVVLGENVTIMEPVNLYGCTIGDRTFIGPYVEIQGDVSIGKNCRIQSHAFICSLVDMGDDCIISHGAKFVNDPFTNNGPACGDKSLWKPTRLGDNVSIGTNATIMPVSICSNVVIGAGSVVTRDISEPGYYCGTPARFLRSLNGEDASPVPEISLGGHWSFNLINDPKRLAFVLARYRFAARMAGRSASILELGCSEGIGTPILTENGADYVGVDLDTEAVNAGKANFGSDSNKVIDGDFLGQQYGQFDCVVSMDVVEHIEPEREQLFFQTVHENLSADGICVIGTPNIASEQYASEASRQGHINLFDGARLRAAMEQCFHNVFLFSMNDEVVHTGFEPMAHFLLAVGANRRKERV